MALGGFAGEWAAQEEPQGWRSWRPRLSGTQTLFLQLKGTETLSDLPSPPPACGRVYPIADTAAMT